MNKLIVLCIAFTLANAGFAANNVMNTTTENTVSQNSNIKSSSVGTARNWNLTESEWATYQNLMQGEAGYYYADLTPPEVLGYYANNEIERRHYAEIYAKLEHEKIERELKFNNAFTEAAVRLYGNEPIITPFDITPYTPIHDENKKALSAGDHLALFIDVKEDRSVPLTSLINQIKANPGVVLDVYCVNATDDSLIQQWAKTNQIPIDLVHTGRITLNHDNNHYKKVTGGSSLPTVMMVHDGKSKLVDMGAF